MTGFSNHHGSARNNIPALLHPVRLFPTSDFAPFSHHVTEVWILGFEVKVTNGVSVRYIWITVVFLSHLAKMKMSNDHC
jgi:hypothetical protein